MQALCVEYSTVPLPHTSVQLEGVVRIRSSCAEEICAVKLPIAIYSLIFPANLKVHRMELG